MMSPLNSFPLFEKKPLNIEKGHYTNICTFEMASLVNIRDTIIKEIR